MTEFTAHDFLAALDREECWRVVSEWPAYEVSSHGRVRRIGSAACLQPAIVRGYLVVTLSDRLRRQNMRLHKLVAVTFLGAAPFVDALVAHNDGDSTNNRVGNLRWASARENQRDRVRHRTEVRGSRVFGAKLHEDQIPGIRSRVAAGETYPTIARDYGVSVSTIHLIAKRKIWTHVAADGRHAEEMRLG